MMKCRSMLLVALFVVPISLFASICDLIVIGENIDSLQTYESGFYSESDFKMIRAEVVEEHLKTNSGLTQIDDPKDLIANSDELIGTRLIGVIGDLDKYKIYEFDGILVGIEIVEKLTAVSRSMNAPIAYLTLEIEGQTKRIPLGDRSPSTKIWKVN